jgi:hypothetical protein
MSPFELDHLFVCSAADAPEAERLLDLGFVEGKRNTHRGQGTANRCIFFRNAMFELLWVHDEAEAASPLTAPTRLLERWRRRHAGASPFGICLRPRAPTASLPFEGWKYEPAYLPAPMSIHIGATGEMSEPMLFYMAPGYRPDQVPPPWNQPIDHALGVREITRVTVSIPDNGGLSQALMAAVDSGVLDVRRGESHAIEIGFDGERAGRSADLGPDLPVRLSW